MLQAAGLLLVIEIEQENGEGKRKRETEARTYVGGVRRWCVSAGGCEFVGVGTPPLSRLRPARFVATAGCEICARWNGEFY